LSTEDRWCSARGLEELGESGKGTLEVYNKADLLEQPPRPPPGDYVLQVSAPRLQRISRLLEMMAESIAGAQLLRARGRGEARQG